MLYESHKLQESQQLHESEIDKVFLLLMAFRKSRDLITKTLHNQDIVSLKGSNLMKKIIFLVNGYLTHAHLQYEGAGCMGSNFEKIDYYSNLTS